MAAHNASGQCGGGGGVSGSGGPTWCLSLLTAFGTSPLVSASFDSSGSRTSSDWNMPQVHINRSLPYNIRRRSTSSLLITGNCSPKSRSKMGYIIELKSLECSKPKAWPISWISTKKMSNWFCKLSINFKTHSANKYIQKQNLPSKVWNNIV